MHGSQTTPVERLEETPKEPVSWRGPRLRFRDACRKPDVNKALRVDKRVKLVLAEGWAMHELLVTVPKHGDIGIRQFERMDRSVHQRHMRRCFTDEIEIAPQSKDSPRNPLKASTNESILDLHFDSKDLGRWQTFVKQEIDVKLASLARRAMFTVRRYFERLGIGPHSA